MEPYFAPVQAYLEANEIDMDTYVSNHYRLEKLFCSLDLAIILEKLSLKRHRTNQCVYFHISETASVQFLEFVLPLLSLSPPYLVRSKIFRIWCVT